MRVIGGLAKGRKLKSVKGMTTRPTADRVKEALFNILQGEIEESNFLDLYAGTGNIGIEALSRGAKIAVFIDEDRQAINVLKENLSLIGLEEKGEVYQQDVLRALRILGKKRLLFDLIFLDPPYRHGLEEKTLFAISANNLLLPQGLVIVEHLDKNILPLKVDALELVRKERYGDTAISFYRKREDH